jgi:iron complex outermembrane receptor protein
MKTDGFQLSILALCCAAACLHPARAAHAADADQAANNAGDNQSGSGLEEIIVTAQRREERLQDVPISVTALSAQTLDLRESLDGRSRHGHARITHRRYR